MEPWAIWLIFGVALLIIEMFSLTFYLLWLGLGAIAAMIASFVAPDSFVAQALTGVVVALLLTLFTKPLTRRLRSSKGFKDPIDELVGKQGIIIEDIEVGKPGIVKVGSETWSATASERLIRGDTVLVVHRGTTLLEVRKTGG